MESRAEQNKEMVEGMVEINCMCTNPTSNLLKSLIQTLITWSVHVAHDNDVKPYHSIYHIIFVSQRERRTMDNGMPKNREKGLCSMVVC